MAFEGIQFAPPSEAVPEALAGAPAEPAPGARLDDLAQIIRAYNQVTENLQRSHEALRVQVARLQEQLASADAQLQRSKRLAALGEMAAGIAHEIRNPLGAIQLYAGVLVEDLGRVAGEGAGFRVQGSGQEESGARSRGSGVRGQRGGRRTRSSKPETRNDDGVLAASAETARKIAAAVRGLDAIVGDVLSFAREITPRPMAVPVDLLFDRALEAQRPALTAGAITVRRMGAEAEELVVHADFDLLHQALLNLIRNAVEAMTERGGAGERVLALGAQVEDGAVVLTVRDTGPGVPATLNERIFNPFFTTRHTGTGLGLAIVHRIVDAHGGTIAVHNDGGAVFELRLPKNEFTTEDTENPEGGEDAQKDAVRNPVPSSVLSVNSVVNSSSRSKR